MLSSTRGPWRAILTLILTGLLQPVQAQPAPAAPAPIGSDLTFGPITLRDESIDQVLTVLERLTGKTILRPQAMPTAAVTLSLRESVSKAEAIQAIETLLNLNGIAVTPLGSRFLKVTPLNLAKSEAPEFIEGSTLGLTPSGRMASKLFQLSFLRINEFMPQINGLLNPAAGAQPMVFEKSNAALITDSVSNLQRVEALVAKLDQPFLAGLQPKFYALHFAKASEVMNKIRSLFSGPLQNQIGTATSYNADDRTNQLIVVCDPRQLAFFDELVTKLDVKSDPNTRNEVIYLKHAAAKDVSTILSQLVSGQNNASKSSGQEALRPVVPGVPTPGAAPAAPTPAPAPAVATPALAVANLGLNLESSNQFSSLLTILPDDRSNALVVSGTVDDIRLINELVAKIDTLLAQVRIEVVIAEVTLSDKDSSGINALNLTVATDATAKRTGITAFDTGTAANGIAGWNITGGVVNPLAFNAAMGNTGSRHNVKILSAPTIVTTHNKEAKFVSSQQQPIITGSQSTAAATTAGFTTNSQVTYKDIGITLTVTPLIGDDGSIQLKIDQIVDDVVGNVTVDNNVQPIIGHREANSFVNVQDGQMIVLGGLQRNAHTRDRTKLGFLWEIPILSHLLGGRGTDVERTELLLFIRPHVMPPGDTTPDTSQKINELSNKDQVNQFLADPTKSPKDTLQEKIK